MFASRSQLCVHQPVKSLAGVVQQAACDQAVKHKSCTYWSTAPTIQEQKRKQLENIADIEDLVHVGMAKHVRQLLHLLVRHIVANVYACLPRTVFKQCTSCDHGIHERSICRPARSLPQRAWQLTRISCSCHTTM